jgi:hypothetical protein
VIARILDICSHIHLYSELKKHTHTHFPIQATWARSPHAPFPPLTRLLHATYTPRAGACARRPRTLSIDMSGGDATVGIMVWPSQSGELYCTGFVQVRDSQKKSLVKNVLYY